MILTQFKVLTFTIYYSVNAAKHLFNPVFPNQNVYVILLLLKHVKSLPHFKIVYRIKNISIQAHEKVWLIPED